MIDYNNNGRLCLMMFESYINPRKSLERNYILRFTNEAEGWTCLKPHSWIGSKLGLSSRALTPFTVFPILHQVARLSLASGNNVPFFLWEANVWVATCTYTLNCETLAFVLKKKKNEYSLQVLVQLHIKWAFHLTEAQHDSCMEDYNKWQIQKSNPKWLPYTDSGEIEVPQMEAD